MVLWTFNLRSERLCPLNGKEHLGGEVCQFKLAFTSSIELQEQGKGYLIRIRPKKGPLPSANWFHSMKTHGSSPGSMCECVHGRNGFMYEVDERPLSHFDYLARWELEVKKIDLGLWLGSVKTASVLAEDKTASELNWGRTLSYRRLGTR